MGAQLGTWSLNFIPSGHTTQKLNSKSGSDKN